MPETPSQSDLPANAGGAQPATPEGQRTSPAEAVSAKPSDGAGQRADGPTVDVDLDALLSNDAVVKELNRRLVDPAVSKVEFNRQREREAIRSEVSNEIRAQMAQDEQDRRVERYLAASESPDAKVREAALKELTAHLRNDRATKQQLTAQQQAERKALDAVAERLFGIDPSTIPQDVVGDLGKLRRYLATESPELRALREEQARATEGNAREVDKAKGAAGYAETLAGMRNPHLGGVSAPSAAPANDFDSIERGYLAGKVPVAEYIKARVQNGLPARGY
jgi:hypothetical protein